MYGLKCPGGPESFPFRKNFREIFRSGRKFDATEMFIGPDGGISASLQQGIQSRGCSYRLFRL